VHACVALFPAGEALYLAMEKCMYCQHFTSFCDTTEYCTALDNSSDGGSDAQIDAIGDAAGDAAGDATGE
jgi:hypothetical protein